MKKEKQVCDFNIKKFNKIKRLSEEAGGPARGKKPNKTTTTTSSTTSTTTQPPQPPVPDPDNTGIIFLEFYGTVVSNTLWNTNGTITAGHSGLTETEIQAVTEIVTGHFAGFNCIVTTDEDVFNAGTPGNRIKIIFTESYEWYPSSAGGVAYINSFTWTSPETPAFVFTTPLNYNVHNIGEAGAHETGHTLGCRHQVVCQNGVIVSAYNWGDGVNAPVMGASYNVPVGSWWVGPSSLGCSAIQDDRQIITSTLGLL